MTARQDTDRAVRPGTAPARAGNEAAVTATSVPPLSGGPGSHGSEATHAFTIADSAGGDLCHDSSDRDGRAVSVKVAQPRSPIEMRARSTEMGHGVCVAGVCVLRHDGKLPRRLAQHGVDADKDDLSPDRWRRF